MVGAREPPLGQGRDAVDPGERLAGVVPAGAGGPLAAPFVGVAEPLVRPAEYLSRQLCAAVVGASLLQR